MPETKRPGIYPWLHILTVCDTRPGLTWGTRALRHRPLVQNFPVRITVRNGQFACMFYAFESLSLDRSIKSFSACRQRNAWPQTTRYLSMYPHLDGIRRKVSFSVGNTSAYTRASGQNLPVTATASKEVCMSFLLSRVSIGRQRHD